MDTRNIKNKRIPPLINHGLNLLMTLTASATSLTAYRATQLRFLLTALTGFSFHFLCTFVWSSCQVSNGRQHSDKHYVGVWMSSFIKPLSSGARKKSYTLRIRVCGELTLYTGRVKCAGRAHSHSIGCRKALSHSNTSSLALSYIFTLISHLCVCASACERISLSTWLSLSARWKPLLP